MAVYFIQGADGTGPIKIGYAKDPKKRLAEIQRMSPVLLTILNAIEGDRKREGAIHRHFADLRLFGEWFKATDALLAFIANPPILPQIKQEKVKPLEDKQQPAKINGFTINEVAQALQLSERTIRRWIKAGRLYAVECSGRFGMEYRIPASAITALGFRVLSKEVGQR